MTDCPNPDHVLRQQQRNQQTRGDWQSFAGHRQRVTELLVAAAPQTGGSLCVLGAGNGNDLELTRLLDHYHSITLVDLDHAALNHARANCPSPLANRVQLIGGVDVSGVLPLSQNHSHAGALDAGALDAAYSDPGLWDDQHQVNRCLAAARVPQHPWCDSTFDVVASTCLLTQIIESLIGMIGADHPGRDQWLLAGRDGHLRLLGDLTRSGGHMVLITDVVSSDTLPQLTDVDDAQLPMLIGDAIGQGNFFSGTNPAVLLQRICTPAVLGVAATAQLHLPWRWHLGTRTYAVCAVTATTH